MMALPGIPQTLHDWMMPTRTETTSPTEKISIFLHYLSGWRAIILTVTAREKK
jgi:hypothetical protein